VDMFYFPIVDTTFPTWIPFIGGNHFEFFNAIFNFSDAAITIGVILLIISYIGIKGHQKKTKKFLTKTKT
jgi:signal peptidase II